MGLRDKMNQYRGVSVTLAVVVLAAAGIAIAYQVAAMGPRKAHVGDVYFTTDEGKTLFADSEARLPPFEHDGAQAVRAHVYRCGDEQSVAYLERYTADAHKLLTELEDATRNHKPGDPPPKNLGAASGAQRSGREVKRPGDAEWVSVGSPKGQAITMDRPQCAEHENGLAEMVLP